METAQFTCIATCLDPFVPLLKQELLSLGAYNIHTHYRAVQFDVDTEGFYRVHLCTRLASQIYLLIDKIPGRPIDRVFKFAKKISFDSHIDFNKDYSFRIDARQVQRGDGFPSSNDLSKAIRLALQDKKPTLRIDLQNPDICIQLQSFKNQLIVCLNTTGESLHKRGYRTQAEHPATLKESFAAALLQFAEYDAKNETLFDPMCGSGTFAFEASLMQRQKPSQWKRSFHHFAFSKLKNFCRQDFEGVKNSLKQNTDDSPNLPPIIIRDIEARYLEIAKENAIALGSEVRFDTAIADFFTGLPPAVKPGLLVSNLPYGKRLDQDVDFYEKLGNRIKFTYPGWRFGLLVPAESAYKRLGFRFDKKMRFKNGGIDVLFLLFSVYDSPPTFQKLEHS